MIRQADIEDDRIRDKFSRETKSPVGSRTDECLKVHLMRKVIKNFCKTLIIFNDKNFPVL